jgi:hypothetical protein
MSVLVGFMVDKLALGQVFVLVLRVLWFFPVNIIPPWLHAHYHLEDEEKARWLPQFRDMVSRRLHKKQQHCV